MSASAPTARRAAAPIERVRATACTIPTDAPESDGTIAWDSTTIVLVELRAGGIDGLGYTYGDPAVAQLIHSTLAGIVQGRDVLAIPAAWSAMAAAVRNAGRPGLASHAISAVDIAMHDLKARLLGLPLADLLGRAHDEVAVYGSGGFTSYSDARLAEQLAGWVEQGIPRVKMKVGREPARDPDRVRTARDAIGDDAALFIDANGAFDRKRALAVAHACPDVAWFEEPVTSDDLEGLRMVRDRVPAGMEVAAGEYGYMPAYFARMAQAVDVLQADATRCGGITGFLGAGALCQAHSLPFSAHTAPSIHAHAGAAAERLVHLEWFHDHVRIEAMLFDGVLTPERGALRPAADRPGLGLEIKRREVERWAV